MEWIWKHVEQLHYEHLVMSQLLHVFECRSERHSIFEIKLFTNPYLVGAVCISSYHDLQYLYIPFLKVYFIQFH